MKKILLSLSFVFAAFIGYAQVLSTQWVPASGSGTYSTNITNFPNYTNRVTLVKFANTNVGAATIAINGLAAQPLRKWDGSAWVVLTGGEIEVNTVYKISYSGSFFELESFSAGGSGDLEIGVTEIVDGNNTKVLYDSLGFLGQYAVSGSGNVAMTTSPVFTTPNIGSATGSISGNSGTATALATGRTIAITGDLAYTSPSFDGTGNVTAAGTLATVNSNVGSFGTSTQSPTITVNAKGLITAVSNTTITTGASVGSNNEVQTSDGSGGHVASKLFFDETTGNLTLGDAGLSGSTRTMSVQGSSLNVGLSLSPKGTGSFSFGTATSNFSILGTVATFQFTDLSTLNGYYFDANTIGFGRDSTPSNGTVAGADANGTSLNGSNLIVRGGNAFTVGNNNGANLQLTSGTKNGSGLDGNVVIETFNNTGTLKLNSGANEQMGLATLVGGTVTVNNTKVTANSFIFLTRRTTGGVVGHLSYTIVAGTSFTINAGVGTDTSTVNWLIIEPN